MLSHGNNKAQRDLDSTVSLGGAWGGHLTEPGLMGAVSDPAEHSVLCGRKHNRLGCHQDGNFVPCRGV